MVFADNQFLALPIEYFHHFERGDGFLEVKQLLLLMALFCNATLSDQLTWMFHVFDQDGDNTMTEVGGLAATHHLPHSPHRSYRSLGRNHACGYLSD